MPPAAAIVLLRGARATALIALLTCVAAARAGTPGPTPALANPGFEEPAGPAPWTLHVYGARPEVTPDTERPREGARSLRISSGEPTDAALGQELLLKAGRWYRFTGWVRTRGLTPTTAAVCGTYQIQMPGGRSVIASGPSHTGDTDWTRVSLVFRAPPGGLTRIAVFFAGYGLGAGTAWFDAMTIEETPVNLAPLRVTREAIRGATISPLQYGQFVEYLCDLVPGMWAEKLHDGSFEGLTPYAFTFLKETDFREKPWYPAGAVNRSAHSDDAECPVSGRVARRIAVAGGPPCTVGVSQDGIALRRGEPLRLGLFLRSEGLREPVTVRLHRGGRVYASAQFRPADAWRKLTARLEPDGTDDDATLSVRFRGPGTLWIDSASLMPLDAPGGWRRDVVEALRALKPGVIRFGGSVVDYPAYGDYDWRATIGDPDRRRPFRSWGGLQPQGAGLEELVQLCRMVSAEPLICVRFLGSTPEEAAAQVEYFNGAADTPMGRQRAANGRAEPYRVRYWQVGNEVQSAEYDAGLAAFCHAMRAVDPGIELLSANPTPGLLRGAGDLLSYVCPHHYGCDNLAAMEANVESIRRMVGECAPDRDIRIAVTEWNTTAGDWGPARARLWTLANALACSRYHNLMHRNADIVKIANRSNLTNSFCSGIIQTDNRRLYLTPTYYAQQLYATLAGTTPLALETQVAAGVDVSATLSRDRRALTLFVVNDGGEDEQRMLDLSAWGGAPQDTAVWTLADARRAGEPDASNGFADPRRIAPVRSRHRADSPRFTYRFPAFSLTVLRWKVSGR
ncbi:MAG: hypothetical protein IT208_00875 [Chthonomonadales bacterium]|nr:hypothetical protein [Chthonomonadales bacterium]